MRTSVHIAVLSLFVSSLLRGEEAKVLSATDAHEKPVKLAIIAEKDPPVCRVAFVVKDLGGDIETLVDLMEVNLSGDRQVEVVERTESRKTLAEHALLLTGQADQAHRVRAAALLKADVLVIVSKENDYARLHVSGTRAAYVLGVQYIPLPLKDIEARVRSVCEVLRRCAKKATAPPAALRFRPTACG